MKANYHTHTARCKHAGGTDREYIEAAIEAGFDILGFADHAPWEYRSDFVSPIRMESSELGEYVTTLRALGKEYAPQIKIHVGLEAEYFPLYFPWLVEQKRLLGIDYLILGNHFDQTDETSGYFGAISDAQSLRRYVDAAIKGMETGEFVYFAHPDLFMRGYESFDADCRQASLDLCQAAKALNMPLEYNLQGVGYSQNSGKALYPHPLFWEIAAREGVRAILGSDAHDPQWLGKTVLWDEMHDLLVNMGISVMDVLPLDAGAACERKE